MVHFVYSWENSMAVFLKTSRQRGLICPSNDELRSEYSAALLNGTDIRVSYCVTEIQDAFLVSYWAVLNHSRMRVSISEFKGHTQLTMVSGRVLHRLRSGSSPESLKLFTILSTVSSWIICKLDLIFTTNLLSSLALTGKSRAVFARKNLSPW